MGLSISQTLVVYDVRTLQKYSSIVKAKTKTKWLSDQIQSILIYQNPRVIVVQMIAPPGIVRNLVYFSKLNFMQWDIMM